MCSLVRPNNQLEGCFSIDIAVRILLVLSELSPSQQHYVCEKSTAASDNVRPTAQVRKVSEQSAGDSVTFNYKCCLFCESVGGDTKGKIEGYWPKRIEFTPILSISGTEQQP